MSWVSATYNTYVGNATATRDFRVQLRGNRAILVFGLYLLILIGVTMLFYTSVNREGSDVVSMQGSLQGFYLLTVNMLAAAITLIAPALSATTIVTERHRKSLDLIFSAPVPPKYYLVGKMLASYRYTWMLLVLSLPITATTVVLGGATWADVLTTYALLSMLGLVFSAIALLMSVLAPRPISAVIWAYGAVGLYLLVTGILSSAAAVRPSMLAGPTSEASFVVGLMPFTVSQAAGTYTAIGSVHVPNLLLVLVSTLLLTKILLLAAGAGLSPAGGREVPGLRIHTLLYTAVLAFLAGRVLGGLPFASADSAGLTIGWICMALVFNISVLSTYGFDRERRYWPNGAFSINHMFDGTPAGSLPFILMFIAVVSGGVTFGWCFAAHHAPIETFGAYTLYSAGLWLMLWSIGRLTSSSLRSLSFGRVSQLAVMMLLTVIPSVFLSATSSQAYGEDAASIWDFYLLRPLLPPSPAHGIRLAFIDGGIFLFVGIVLAIVAEDKLRKRLSTKRLQHDPLLQTEPV